MPADSKRETQECSDCFEHPVASKRPSLRRVGYAALFLGASLFAIGQQTSSPIASIESLIRSQQYDQALQIARSALREHPNDVRLWTLEGIVFSLKGSNHEALAAFEKARSLSPADTVALKGEVELLYQAQDKRAIPLLERLLLIRSERRDSPRDARRARQSSRRLPRGD